MSRLPGSWAASWVRRALRVSVLLSKARIEHDAFHCIGHSDLLYSSCDGIELVIDNASIWLQNLFRFQQIFTSPSQLVHHEVPVDGTALFYHSCGASECHRPQPGEIGRLWCLQKSAPIYLQVVWWYGWHYQWKLWGLYCWFGELRGMPLYCAQ